MILQISIYSAFVRNTPPVKSLREPVIEVLEKKWEDYKHGIFT